MKTIGVSTGKQEKQGDGGTETVQETKAGKSHPLQIQFSVGMPQWLWSSRGFVIDQVRWARIWPGCSDCKKWWRPTPVFSPGESHAQRSLAGYGPWGCKDSDTTEWLNLFTAPLETTCPQTPKTLWESSGPTLSHVGFNNPVWWKLWVLFFFFFWFKSKVNPSSKHDFISNIQLFLLKMLYVWMLYIKIHLVFSNRLPLLDKCAVRGIFNST